MTPDQMAALRALAEKATPGPWEMERGYAHSPDVMAGELVVAVTIASDMPRQMDKINAAYIAAAHPAAVLALLDRVRVLEEALAIAKMIPDLQRDVMTAPQGDMLASANAALREAYQRLAALGRPGA